MRENFCWKGHKKYACMRVGGDRVMNLKKLNQGQLDKWWSKLFHKEKNTYNKYVGLFIRPGTRTT